MARKYSAVLSNLASGSSADTFKTLLSLKAGSTTGHRGRLISLEIGPADDSPQDLNGAIRINRADQTTDGTSTAQTPAKLDPSAEASVMTGGVNHTAEPTTYETVPLWEVGFNTRGSFFKEWLEADAPRWGPDETLGLLIAPRSNNQITVSATVVWEEE